MEVSQENSFVDMKPSSRQGNLVYAVYYTKHIQTTDNLPFPIWRKTIDKFRKDTLFFAWGVKYIYLYNKEIKYCIFLIKHPPKIKCTPP